MSKHRSRKSCVVRFVPDNVTVEVPRGGTILDAARKAGVFINSLCGGDGVCGKCRVIVREGNVEGGGTEFFTRDEIREGYILACQAQIAGDLEVEVPAESRVRAYEAEVGVAEQRLSEAALLERRPAALNPLVKKFSCKVPPPTLDYHHADLERLEDSLRSADGGGECQMGLKIIRTLPDVVRRADGRVTATIAYRGSLAEITEVVAGDAGGKNLAVAVDVGTTTIIAHLVDLSVGQTVGTVAKYNSQAAYGADIIHRIIWCTDQPEGLSQLHKLIIDDINGLIRSLEENFHLSTSDITFIAAAGNTTMMHILLGIDPQWIRREPYCGVTYRPPPFRAAELGLNISPRGLLYCLPCVSAFVGADITSGVMAVGLHEADEPTMLIDMGTNGEIVIGNKEWLVCASASAGPAFEGAGTRDGMRAMRGAIDHLRWWSPYRSFSYSTVGDGPPAGLCGTAYVDLLAELVRTGVMDKTGRLDLSNGSDRLRTGQDGTPEFVIVPRGEKGAERDLVITQTDIANLVRAKGAIYAGTKVLLKSLGIKFSDIKEILIAGTFGNYLDLENAVSIGLLPDMSAERLRFVGNTSIIGAKMAALSREQYEQARKIADGITYFDLSTDPTFMEEFTSACFLPHTNIEEFPTVLAKFSSGS